MLKPKTASEIATPGHTAIHGARSMYGRPEPDSIAPHDGYGGGTPKPRNESADSARMTAPRPIVARMMIVAATFGSKWRTMMRACPQPMARAASTNWLCITLSVAPRITREFVAAAMMATEMMRLSRPGPSTAITDKMMTRYGNDSHASTIRCTTSSHGPPRWALDTPMAVATAMASAMVAKPTVTETRAPYTMRLHMSRLRLSVPSQCAALGGLIRAPRIVSSKRYGAI